jgi:hypothetical protein
MKIQLYRDTFTEKSTIGSMYIDGVFECYTLEDVIRLEKVYGQTAIPCGVYKIVLNFSPKYNRIMPQIIEVPNFEGIRIHSGNKAEDTEGCILVGQSKSKDWINNSVKAYKNLFTKLEKAFEANDLIEITIS